MLQFFHILTIVVLFGVTVVLIYKNNCKKMQNRAAKVITGRSYEVPSADVLKEIGWQSLEDRRKFTKLIFMHKVKCKALPDTMTSMFNVNNNSIYNRRSNNTDYALQKPNTNFIKKSIAYSGASVWNNLHRNIKRKQLPMLT